MASNKKILSLVLAMILCMGLFSTVALAEGGWNGDGVTAEITKGENGYEFQSVYGPAYEMSGHMVSVNMVNHDIPQTLILVPADRSYTWSPNGQYGSGANYEVLYCCDADTGYATGIHYKRINLEDSTYYSNAAADKIRAIVSISYPFKSEAEMKSILKSKGFADADKLTRGEIISGVQSAIWYFANNNNGIYRYSQTFDVATNSQWGSVMHDFAKAGIETRWWNTGKRVFTVNGEVGDRINALREFLIALPGVDAKAGQIVITNLEIKDIAPVEKADGIYRVSLDAKLNKKANKKTDDVTLTVTVNGTAVYTKSDFNGNGVNMTVEAKNGDVIEVVVAGTQILDTGVYFYEPEGGREKSQSLVGVARGETAVHAAASVVVNVPGAPETPETPDEPETPEEPETPDEPETPTGSFIFPKGGASNISYMLIKDGKVEFVKKIDLQDGDTTAPVITKEGYIAAMFIKQSTSGKFWIEEQVDDATVQAVIKCLIANNPSYSGHDEEIAFGYGTHTLTYTKKNGKSHTVPYTFVK